MDAQRLLIPYRLQTVRFGLLATVLAVVALVVYPLVPGPQVFDPVLYSIVVVGAASGAVVVRLLPWERLLSSGWGMWFFYVWSVLDIVLISVGVLATGGSGSQLYLIYVLTTIFFALIYPLGAQVVLLMFTFACYYAATLVHGDPPLVQDLYIRMAILGVTAYLASRLARELTELVQRHQAAHAESERRASLLAAVARAGRAMNSLDSERILDVVADSALSLGYDATNMKIHDPASGTVRIAQSRGLPESFTRGREHAAALGVAGLVLKDRRTVVVQDYASHPSARPELVEAGIRSAIASPVWVNNELAGVLVAGSREGWILSDVDVEAFELLAVQAGRALENARRFEEEHEAVTRLAQLDRLKRDFIATVSHELRTPLTAIGGMGRTLQMHWERLDPDAQLDFVDRIVANAASLEDIITTLLDFSRLEEGRMVANPAPVDVRAVLGKARGRLMPLFAEHPLEVDVSGEIEVVADPVLLERVVENLLSNAVKHTPPGTPIVMGAQRNGTSAYIRVSDRGPGIPDEELAHLGERFFRGGGDHTTRRTRGAGLGLAIVREILRLHDSVLEIDTEVGEGSSFSFRLPLRESGREAS